MPRPPKILGPNWNSKSDQERIIRPPGERVRELLGLPRGNRRQVRQVFRGTPTLLGFSAAVVPPPADWSSGQLITGYWFLDDGAPPEPERGRIEEFLAAGDPPVYVGFGSMSTRDAAGTMASSSPRQDSAVFRVRITDRGNMRSSSTNS